MMSRFQRAFPLALCAFAILAGPAAQAQSMKTVNGEAYWDVDPGPIDPGSFWTSGQYKYDPNGYMERYARQSEQVHEMTVYADHAGKERCVFRKRVINSSWESQHPYLRVCRR
jgi:hypothetical protein